MNFCSKTIPECVKAGLPLFSVGNVLFSVTRKIITMYSFCFLSVPVNSSQLQLILNPNQNEINSPNIPFHHECFRWFKKRPLEHWNQIMYIKQFSRIFYCCPLNKSSSSAVCVYCLESSKQISTTCPNCSFSHLLLVIILIVVV